MTNEDMAEEYAKGLCKTCTLDTCRYSTIQTCAIKEFIKQAHLAGLKAGSQLDMVWHDYDAGEDCYEDTHEGRWIKRESGKPKWHNLRENPSDLPEPYMSVINQNGRNVLYDYIHKVWRYDDANEYICDTPIAWCEIPTYKEVSK